MCRLTATDNLFLDATPATRKSKWVSIHRFFLLRGSISLCILTYCTVATGKDEVPYKPRDYTPSKTLHSNTYEPKEYAPKPQTPSKQLRSKPADSKPLTDPKSLADKSIDAAASLTGKTVDKPSAFDGKAYIPGESAFPSTISVDKSFASQEKKSFLVSSNSSPFIVTERPEERNPLLEPKQGIKAPVETTPTKDQTK